MKTDEWELEEIIHEYLDEDGGWDLYNKVMDWHKQLLSKEKQELKKKVEGVKKEKSRFSGVTNDTSQLAFINYNQAINDILTLLEE